MPYKMLCKQNSAKIKSSEFLEQNLLTDDFKTSWKKKRLKNILFEYRSGVFPSATKEAAIINNLNMWFSPLINDFNNENAVIVVFFLNELNNVMSFKNISDALQDRAVGEYNKYIIEAGLVPHRL